MKKIMLLLVSVMVIATFALTGCGSKATTQLNEVGTSVDGNEVAIEKAAIRLGEATAEGDYQLVDTATLNQWETDGKKMIIVDTMPASSFTKGHVPNAVNVELPKKAADLKAEQKEAFLAALGADKDTTIVVYCGFVSCERSHVGATIAKETGFKNVYRYPGGIVAWQNAGYEAQK